MKHPLSGGRILNFRKRFGVLTVVCLLDVVQAVFAQATALPEAPPAPTAFPKADQRAVAEHLARAREIAGKDLQAEYAHRCILNQIYPQRTRAMQQYMLIEPAKVFDNVYFLGHHGVSAWIVKTTQGLVLFDALEDPEQAKDVIVAGMRKLSLDPMQIKYVVITHGHGDHFGGATFFQRNYGSRLMASAADWQFMQGTKERHEGPPRWAELVPSRDMEITDGQKFVVGDVTFNFFITPGHTPGTVSTFFKTTHNGKPHVIAFYGGGGIPQTAVDTRLQIKSQGRFIELAHAADADVLLANHQTQDGSLVKLEELRSALPGEHPYVIGADAVIRYFRVQQECARVSLARQGERE
jgi:metallo-beta-lactamase class B